jgi:ferric-dicitrate binding protein FerR (iron transport regulator)
MIPEQVKNYISGNYTEEDRLFVEKWISVDSDREALLAQLEKIWKESEGLKQLSEKEIDCAWRSVKTKMGQGITVDVQVNQERRKKGIRAKRLESNSWVGSIWKLAAIILLGFGLYSLIPQQISNEVSEDIQEAINDKRVIKAEYGEQIRFRLSDQSVVTLNGGSEVSFSENYGLNDREITLSGEAYFEVNNTGQMYPLMVITDKAVVTDIGTSFNVNAYKEKETTDIVVADGEIEVRLNTENTSPAINLRQGDMVKVEGSEDEFTIQKVDLENALGWMQGKLTFENERFEDIVYRLERFYNIDIEIAVDSLNNERITASFENEQLERVLNVLAVSLSTDYEQNGSVIVFQ